MKANLNILRGYLNQDEKMVNKFLRLFCQTTPEELHKLDEYLRNSEFEMSSITAHGLKTQCAYLGLYEAEEVAYQIENIERADAINSILHNELVLLLDAVILDLKMTLTKE